MAKGRKTSNRKRTGDEFAAKGLLLFRPITWYSHEDVGRYIGHALTEIGRLGLSIYDVERRDRAPHAKMVLSDTLDWLSRRNNGGFQQLYDWIVLDQEALIPSTGGPRKPRIEITAEITKMENLSVRWYPAGWHQTILGVPSRGQSTPNLVKNREWPQKPDFRWFTGDESPYFDSRATNELMYIRGVGNLSPEPREEYGYYAKFNHDVLDAIQICIVRAAYEGLIKQLELHFEVAARQTFDFTVREEENPLSSMFAIERVVGWTLEDTEQLRLRNERAKAREQFEEASLKLSRLEGDLNIQVDEVVAALAEAASNGKNGVRPTFETLDKNAAKKLRMTGHILDTADVRRIRKAVELCRSDLLPESLRPKGVSPLEILDNVVPLKR